MRSRLSPSHRLALLCATSMLSGFAAAGAYAQVPNSSPPPGIAPSASQQAPQSQGSNSVTSGAAANSAPRVSLSRSGGGNGRAESITVRAQRRLLRERNAPTAVTELGSQQIAQTGVQGSVATLLRAAPSVYVYQQGIGNNEPVLTIRGIRGLEVASTYDGVPTQDLLSGGSGSYLTSILGGRFNLDQISGVSIYPGVAYPNISTFGTIGGTIAYTSLRPDNEAGADLFGSVGSFGTWNEGFDVNSGRMDGILGHGNDAPKMMLKYSNEQTSGFIDYTPARYNSMEFAFDKPYMDGLSLFQATALYNTGSGLTTPEPIPDAYTIQNGRFSNYSPDQEFQRQYNDYFTLILKNDTYINDYVSAGLTAFYSYTDSYTSSYGDPSIFGINGAPGSAAVGGINPFNQTPAGFGEQGDYGIGAPLYDPIAYPYNLGQYQTVAGGCPASVVAAWAAAQQTNPCGANSEYTAVHTDTYGLQPRITITPPAVFGIDNTIKIGGLLAKETEPNPKEYLGLTSEFAHTPENQIGGFDGGQQRTIYQGYVQDKIDFLHNTLHITPGVTLQTSDSSLNGSEIFNAGAPSAADAATAYCQAGNPCLYGPYDKHKWDRTWLPFLNVAYDLDRILPAARGVSLYASYGASAIFAPIQDYGPNQIPGAGPPNASIVHMYEAGIKYNRNNLSLSLDYFYQHVTRDFGFFQFQSGPFIDQEIYTNDGQREFKGFEAAGIYQLTPRWQLFGNVSYTLAKYLATSLSSVSVQEDQFGLAIRGQPIPGIPNWVSTFGVDYDHKNFFLPDDEFNVRFEGQYTGKQQTTTDATATTNLGAIPGVPGSFGSYPYYNFATGQTFTDPNGGISPFAIFNLDMNYKLPLHNAGPLKSLDFDLNVLNMFNLMYSQYVYKQISPSSCGKFPANDPRPGFANQAVSNYGCSPLFGDSLPGEPAAITFTVKAHF